MDIPLPSSGTSQAHAHSRLASASDWGAGPSAEASGSAAAITPGKPQRERGFSRGGAVEHAAGSGGAAQTSYGFQPSTLSSLSQSGAGLSRAGTKKSRLRNKDRHTAALDSIRDFLKGRSSYDVLPVSFRLVVLDTRLVVRPALDIMWQAEVSSEPLSSSAPAAAPSASEASGDVTQALARDPVAAAAETLRALRPSPQPVQRTGFAGMLTVNDIIHLIQYYYHHLSSYDLASRDVEGFRLERLRDIEASLNVPTPPLTSIAPLRSLYEACQLLIKTHARRLPLLDYDEQTGCETLISVLTQYRVLKFIAMNCREITGLHRSVRSLGIGTYVAGTPGVGAARHIGISAVPIIDNDGFVVDLYESVDVIDLVRSGAYQSLDTTMRQALARRSAEFPGIMSCGPDDSLASIFSLLRTRRVHRLLILEPLPASRAASMTSKQSEHGRQSPEGVAPPPRPRGKLPEAQKNAKGP
ncbi:5'-AMP-activated protein kinase, gamma subunit [Ceraceosorus bombacis]|uniref:5'-AMP-activated protein kinase, gamma subunit n=1 Tax=Ceraceosorus bombacis TaxID=401625 RepID=A0A0P1BDM7_9BASI|nr:5'-AMP-activated protein kinase, gamma subunit [Ceraceosorus bombacis]